MIAQCCCANLCDKLFFAVVFRTKEGSLCQAIQSGGMSSGVGQFMEHCAVILSSTHELFANGKHHFISRGLVVEAMKQAGLTKATFYRKVKAMEQK